MDIEYINEKREYIIDLILNKKISPNTYNFITKILDFFEKRYYKKVN